MEIKAIKNQVKKMLPVLVVIFMLVQSKNTFAQTLFFERVYDESLAQASYVIGDKETRQAIVVDPKRDIDTYLEIANSNNLRIVKVTETHIHADFLSGARELAAATGADLLLSGEGGKDWQYEFAHTPLKEGDTIRIGKLALQVMHTPGHTPESITFLLIDPAISNTPQKALTGDFVFVGDVGRPDLLEKAAGKAGTQEAAAKELFRSIGRFSRLPDDLEIWPGHGAGSFCGKSLSNIPQSTLQQEKLMNRAFQFKDDEKGFLKYVLEDQLEVPRYFSMMKHLNKVSRPLLIEVPKHQALDREALLSAQKNGLLVIDTRDKHKVLEGSIPGSLYIEGGKSFSTWMGSLLDYEQQFILIAEEEKIEDLTRKLMRIGMDNIYGYVSDINNLGITLDRTDVVDISTFKLLKQENKVQVIDVRTAAEYKAGHITGTENIPLSTLEANLNRIDENKPVIIHCQSGTRAAMAYSILKRNGFNNIRSYFGGMKEWKEKGNEVVK